MPDADRFRRLHDPRVLRSIAHPVRNRILRELSAGGPQRAADLARELDVPANQVSFHLRQLAKYGLVVEAPELARDRRDRVWRVADDRSLLVDMAEVEAQPGGRAVADVYRRSVTDFAHAVVEAAHSRERPPGTARRVSDHAIRLTPEEADQLGVELDEVVTRWVERTRGRDDGRRTHVLLQVIAPHPGHLASDEPTPSEGPANGDG